MTPQPAPVVAQPPSPPPVLRVGSAQATGRVVAVQIVAAVGDAAAADRPAFARADRSTTATPIEAAAGRPAIAADVHPTLTPDHGNGVGTMRYQLVALPGVLDDQDVMVHALFDSPREQAIAETGYAGEPVELRRFTADLRRDR